MDKRIFCEVKCDYFCEEENRWYIDAWIDDSDDDGNGRSVGYVDGVSGNIYYKTEDAENDPLVREVATAKQAEVRAEKKKVWVMTQESNVDGDVSFNVIVCDSEKAALAQMEREKEWIAEESNHFKGFDPNDESLEIEESKHRFFIMDECDDYYEEIMVMEKEITTL